MSELRMCDECKTLDPNAANWLTVQPDVLVYSFTPDVQPVQDLHFCSWKCLAAFADHKAEPVAA